MEDNITIGKNIKSYRLSFGLSQEQIADLIKVSRGTINYYESGSRTPSMIALQKLSDLFGIEAIDLLEEKTEELELNSKIAFKKKNLNANDLKAIALFRRITKNYIKLNDNF